MSCELKIQKTQNLAEHLGYKVCSCKKHIVYPDDTIPKTPEGFYDWELINSVPDLQINSFYTQSEHKAMMEKASAGFIDDAYYMAPSGKDYRDWKKIKNYYQIFTPMDEIHNDQRHLEKKINDTLLENEYEDKHNFTQAIKEYYDDLPEEHDNWNKKFKDIVKLGLHVFNTSSYNERGDKYWTTHYINFTKFTKKMVFYEVWEQEKKYDSKGKYFKNVIKKYPYRKLVQEFSSRENGKLEYVKWGNSEQMVFPSNLIHFKDNMKKLRTKKNAANTIIRAWKKCRYNPNYKMCWKVQLRDLEENCGMTFDENDNMVPVN